jgi:hypothetical protein
MDIFMDSNKDATKLLILLKYYNDNLDGYIDNLDAKKIKNIELLLDKINDDNHKLNNYVIGDMIEINSDYGNFGTGL